MVGLCGLIRSQMLEDNPYPAECEAEYLTYTGSVEAVPGDRPGTHSAATSWPRYLTFCAPLRTAQLPIRAFATLIYGRHTM
jgi:hypothetical protein